MDKLQGWREVTAHRPPCPLTLRRFYLYMKALMNTRMQSYGLLNQELRGHTLQ